MAKRQILEEGTCWGSSTGVLLRVDLRRKCRNYLKVLHSTCLHTGHIPALAGHIK
jgi:hypothetical protein